MPINNTSTVNLLTTDISIKKVFPSFHQYIDARNPANDVLNTKVSESAKIRNRYHQVPHLTQDTNGKVTNSQLDTTNESQEVSLFTAGDHKAHLNRRAQNIANTNGTKTLKIHKRCSALERSVKYFTGGPKPV